MYLLKIDIQNIKSLREVVWEIDNSKPFGWHVVLGDNGSGKSSFIRAAALALVGPSEASALRQDWNEWLRKDKTKGFVRLSIDSHEGWDLFSGKGQTPMNWYLQAGLNLSRQEDGTVALTKVPAHFNPSRHIWGGKGGWFSASYGPFRRFSGGNKDYEKMFYSNPKLAPHLSAFGESVALTESIQWLQDLKFKALESVNVPESSLLQQIIQFVNQENFLPQKTILQNISSKGVEFIDGNGCEIGVEELSDGFRSVLSMTFELIRQLVKCYRGLSIFSEDGSRVIVPGVVLIDEIDAHLHPSWQRKIGLWFREHFPYIQFIVTTHSPFVCQAANVGTVWRLPKPGTNESAAMVTGTDLDRLLYGNILDAYSTDMFGTGVTRSEASNQRLQKLAELNVAELLRGLTSEERTEQETLRAMLPTAAHSLVGANGSK